MSHVRGLLSAQGINCLSASDERLSQLAFNDFTSQILSIFKPIVSYMHLVITVLTLSVFKQDAAFLKTV